MSQPAKSYFATKLSNNIAETSEGYLICSNVCIARTGFQTYYLSEIPDDQRVRVGLIGENDDQVKLYRDAREVFSPQTIASFQSKAITDSHPDEMLTSFNTTYHSCGVVNDVRKGNRPLESGDFGLFATLLITDQTLITKVRDGKQREISCGYYYELEKRNGQICQVNLRGNHVACLESGRAGPLASIVDALPETDPYFAALDLNVKRARQAYSTVRERYGK